MSSPETSTESNETRVADLNGHGEKQGDEPEHLAIDSPGELSEVKDHSSKPGHTEEHHNGERDEEDGKEDEDEEDEEDEDEDESDDDDDEEPALKYERIGGSLGDLLKKDSASALTIVNKIMVWP
jgi:hypothetical protein